MISYHSIERAKERLGFNERYASSFLERGILRGSTAKELRKSPERRWLQSKTISGCKAIAYNGVCLIVSECGNCVTVYPLPQWFGKKIHYDAHNRRVRNYARYTRLYDEKQWEEKHEQVS